MTDAAPIPRNALFDDVYERLYRLHVLWRIYDTLFGSHGARAMVSRQHWKVTFALYQRVLFERV